MAKKARTDSEIQQAVLDELKWDTRVLQTEVGVEVTKGVVTLSGAVDSWAKRVAAVEAAHRVDGVLDVANELTVRPSGTGKSDAEIARAVRNTLQWDVFVPDEKITSTVSGGVVTLEGTVEYYTQRMDAERAVRNLAFVKRVVNQLEVTAPATVTSVRESIRKALERHTHKELERITIRAEDGVVTLSGAVDSWWERQAMLGAVRGLAGVRKVVDHLHVR